MGNKSDESGPEKTEKPQFFKFKWEWDDTIKGPIDQNTELPVSVKSSRSKNGSSQKSGHRTSQNIPEKKKEQITPQEETTAQVVHREQSKKEKKKNKSKDSGSIGAYILPTIQKLSAETKDTKVRAALDQLKQAIVDCESNKPGITHKLIARIIETLRK